MRLGLEESTQPKIGRKTFSCFMHRDRCVVGLPAPNFLPGVSILAEASVMTSNKNYKNGLLSAVTRLQIDALEPHLEPVELRLQQQIEYPKRPINFVYFPETGLLSVLALENDRQVEVALIGHEGMSGLPVLLGDDRSPHACVVQATCKAHRIPAAALRAALDSSLPLRELLTKYAHVAMIQMGYSALANGQANIEERLARWLLMSQDRLGDELPLTHELLAYMLGVRRAGVTEALHVLEEKHLIKTSRGRILVTNRTGLKQAARGLYGTPEAEYLRLTGIPIETFGVPLATRKPDLPSVTAASSKENADILAGRRVLVVEDDSNLATALASDLAARGATVLGPGSTMQAALKAVTDNGRIDVAVLDINLQGETVYPLVDLLEGSGVIVVFATGYDPERIPDRYRKFPYFSKPFHPGDLVDFLKPRLI
jgi:CRP-like cAMP-binding protein